MRESSGWCCRDPWGAPELDPLTQLRVIETLAMAEGSAGWCAMIGCDSGYITAFLDEDVAREMYPDIGWPLRRRLPRPGRRRPCAAVIE